MITMLPVPIARVRYFRRYGREMYIAWLSDFLGLGDIQVTAHTRAAIDEYFQFLATKPSWVEAAEQVVEDITEEEEGEELVDSPFTPANYDSWTIRELQDECRTRGITIRGTKAEVVLRLRRHDEGLTTQTEQNETEAPSEEAAEESSDAPEPDVPEEAATEEVTTNADSGETNDIDEEE